MPRNASKALKIIGKSLEKSCFEAVFHRFLCDSDPVGSFCGRNYASRWISVGLRRRNGGDEALKELETPLNLVKNQGKREKMGLRSTRNHGFRHGSRLFFQRLRSRLALKQAKDLARTCASQSESYEKLLKRRQQEVRHLQEG